MYTVHLKRHASNRLEFFKLSNIELRKKLNYFFSGASHSRYLDATTCAALG